MRFGDLGVIAALNARAVAARGAIVVVERDYLLRMAAALLEQAQLTAVPQEAEELTQYADDIITLADELSAPDDRSSCASAPPPRSALRGKSSNN
jgi:ribosomal protein L17